MTITPDILLIVGWVLGGLGIVLLLFEIKGDRARGRLRCKRCWYDLRDTPRVDGGWTCPECGKLLVRERQLRRTRRRWKLVAIALVLMTTPGGLYAGRVAQNDGWASLLPDWVLVRMPIDLGWILEHPDSAEIDLAWNAAPKKSVEGTIRRRAPTMSDGSRRTYSRRVRVALNENQRDHDDGPSLRAFDIADLIEPDTELTEQYRTVVRGHQSRGNFTRRRLAHAAREDSAKGVATLVDLVLNHGRPAHYIYCESFAGLLLVRSEPSEYQRVAKLLSSFRDPRDSTYVDHDLVVARYDIFDLAVSQFNSGIPFNYNTETISILLSELVTPDAWYWNGGAEAGMAFVGRSLVIAAPNGTQEGVQQVLDLLRHPKLAEPLLSQDAEQPFTVSAHDIRELTQRLKRNYVHGQKRPGTTESWSVLPEEEVAEKIRQHLVETLEPDAWIDNGGDDASIRYWNGIFLVRTTLDLDARIRAELARIERGEVELDF